MFLHNYKNNYKNQTIMAFYAIATLENAISTDIFISESIRILVYFGLQYMIQKRQYSASKSLIFIRMKKVNGQT